MMLLPVEVLGRTGVLDDVELSDESNQIVQLVRQKAVQTATYCRNCIHEHVTINNVRNVYENALNNDKMTTMGFASGAAIGLVW